MLVLTEGVGTLALRVAKVLELCEKHGSGMVLLPTGEKGCEELVSRLRGTTYEHEWASAEEVGTTQQPVCNEGNTLEEAHFMPLYALQQARRGR